MSDIAATIEASRIEGDRQITVFRIPAMSEMVVRKRAKANARVKGLEDSEITEVHKLDQTGPLGVPVYEVTVSSSR